MSRSPLLLTRIPNLNGVANFAILHIFTTWSLIFVGLIALFFEDYDVAVLVGTCLAAELMIWHGWCLIHFKNCGNRIVAAIAGTMGFGIIATIPLIPLSILSRMFFRFRKSSPRRHAPLHFSIGDILWGMVASGVVLAILKWMGLLELDALNQSQWLKLVVSCFLFEFFIAASATWFVLSDVGWIARLAPTLILTSTFGSFAFLNRTANENLVQIGLMILVQWAYIVIILLPTRLERVRLTLSWR